MVFYVNNYLVKISLASSYHNILYKRKFQMQKFPSIRYINIRPIPELLINDIFSVITS